VSSIKRVMISSTARDLPRHRKQAMDACLSRGMFPAMMEYLSATHADAVKVSLKMVDEADIYLGIFAHRYGYVPQGYEQSITEMEYHHAIERGIPILIFVIHEDHPAMPVDEEPITSLTKLTTFKQHLMTAHVVKFFRSAEDLRAHIIEALANLQLGDPTPALSESHEFSSELRLNMEKVSKTIKKLTDDQYKILNMLRYQKRVAVQGCAGSGKTLLAVEKAIRLDNAGMRTLILCHSAYLAQNIAQMVGGTGVQVYDFMGWLDAILGRVTPVETWEQHHIPDDAELEQAFDRLVQSNQVYEAIIVDEGQDFHELWWTLIEAALSSLEHGILYIFYDDFQRLHTHKTTYPIAHAPFELTHNIRNSGNVFQIVQDLYPNYVESSELLSGLGVLKFTEFSSSKGEERATMREVLLSTLDAIPAENIIVMTTEFSAEESLIANLEIVEQPTWRWQEAVYRYLGEFPLSDDPYPNADDIARVIAHNRDKASINDYRHWTSEPVVKQLKHVRWHLVNGRLMLTHTTRENNLARPFLLQETWADGIPKPATYTLQPATLERAEHTLPLYTIPAYKGLEADAVILFIHSTFAGEAPQLKWNLYVGLSRGRMLVHVVYDNRIRKRIPHAIARYFEG